MKSGQGHALRRVYRISGILHKKGGEIMTKEKTVIKVRRGLNGFKYSACDAQGNFLGNFAKLADVRRHWRNEIKWGQITLVRELDQMPDMSQIEATKKNLKRILRAYAKKVGGLVCPIWYV